MAFCKRCGAEIVDDAVICPSCGANTDRAQSQGQSNTLRTIAKIFMIISTVCMGFMLIPLAWCIPMTVIYCKKVNNNEPVGIGFKICTLLFVNIVSGICMLIDQDK